MSITCEINPPKNGLNRRVGGAFASDSVGRLWLLHRGNFNARGRVPSLFTRAHFRWQWQDVQDGHRTSQVLAIGALGSQDLIRRIRDFVHEVSRFKKVARDRN